MTTVADIYSAINELIPFDTKESWDNCGILAGDPDKGVTKIITALDSTNDVIEEAKPVLLSTSDAAEEKQVIDIGAALIIKKKKNKQETSRGEQIVN